MEKKINIVTYNIQHGKKNKNIVENILFIAKKASLICLQEVRKQQDEPFIVDEMLKKLGSDWKAECLISEGGFDLGLCTLWNSAKVKSLDFEAIILPKLLKMQTYEKVWLKLYRKYEKVDTKNIHPETKGALIGRFEVNGQILRVTNTHLDWVGGQKQMNAQLGFIKHYLKSQSNYIYEVLCGDFNTLGYYRFFRGRVKKAHSLLSEDFIGIELKRPTTSFWQTLDHIFVKNLEIAKTEVLKLKGSDHYPLLAEIKI